MSIIYTDNDGVDHKSAGKEVPGIASNTNFGTVKLTDSKEVTSNNGLALSATEKNKNVANTLAADINGLDAKIGNTAIATGDTTITGAISTLNSKLTPINVSSYFTVKTSSYFTINGVKAYKSGYNIDLYFCVSVTSTASGWQEGISFDVSKVSPIMNKYGCILIYQGSEENKTKGNYIDYYLINSKLSILPMSLGLFYCSLSFISSV